jgi:hypothetical protein
VRREARRLRLSEVEVVGELDPEQALHTADERWAVTAVDEERLSLPLSTDDETDHVAVVGS